VLEFPGQLNDIVFHHVWVKEDSIIGRPTYHVLALINSPYPGSDDEFMDEVDSCWKWILGDHTSDSVSWCYQDTEGRGQPNFLRLEHLSPTAIDAERMSEESDFRAHFMLCLEWARTLAGICSQHPWQRGVSSGLLRFGDHSLDMTAAPLPGTYPGLLSCSFTHDEIICRIRIIKLFE